LLSISSSIAPQQIRAPRRSGFQADARGRCLRAGRPGLRRGRQGRAGLLDFRNVNSKPQRAQSAQRTHKDGLAGSRCPAGRNPRSPFVGCEIAPVSTTG